LFRPAAGKTVIVGDANDRPGVIDLLKQSKSTIGKIEEVSKPSEADLNEPIEEIIFCSNSLSYREIIQFMSRNFRSGFEYKIAPADNSFLIGSNSIDTAGDLYILNINMLTNSENRRKKRLFDLVVSTFLLLSSPLLIWVFENKSKYLKNISRILLGSLSFIGFSERAIMLDTRLPKIKEGILHPCDAIDLEDDNLRDKLNLLYARDYSMRKDFSIVWKAWRNLDR
jgi:hypothetical protein